jgi:hypothetical protein
LINFFQETAFRVIVSEFKNLMPQEGTVNLNNWNSEMNVTSPDVLLPLRIVRPSDLGPAVRARRREQSLRIDDAAALSGVSVDLLSRLENGKGSVRLDKLLMVLDGLGLALAVGPKDHPWMQTVVHLATRGAERT